MSYNNKLNHDAKTQTLNFNRQLLITHMHARTFYIATRPKHAHLMSFYNIVSQDKQL